MNKFQTFRQSNLAALSISFALANCLAFYCIQPALADKATTEPIVNVEKPYATPESEASKAEAQDVIDVLQIMGKAYARGDIAEYIKHLDNQCSVFDEHKNQMVHGKEAVIAALTEKFAKRSQKGAEHILSYTIVQPYVKVNGNTAVVTYRAIEEVGGAHPRKLEGSMSDVFAKEDGHWMKVHQHAVWKRVK
jgi:ketosteroid isomerase-like protein